MFTHKDSSSLVVEAPFAQAYGAVVCACDELGDVIARNESAGYVSVSIGMQLFPPRNPVGVSIQIKKKTDTETEITFAANAVDGLWNLGSGRKAIAEIVAGVERILS